MLCASFSRFAPPPRCNPLTFSTPLFRNPNACPRALTYMQTPPLTPPLPATVPSAQKCEIEFVGDAFVCVCFLDVQERLEELIADGATVPELEILPIHSMLPSGFSLIDMSTCPPTSASANVTRNSHA